MQDTAATPSSQSPNSIWLRRLAKLTCFSTLFLIFVGGLVKSTESGLSVPDWPTTYGHFMFAFPLEDMVGGIYYEHSHRMIASVVGLFTLILTFWIMKADHRRWVQGLAWGSLFAVILQGVLGGLTVRYFLPAPISVSHATLAQTFFLMTIFLAYALSVERSRRTAEPVNKDAVRLAIIVIGLIYVQLILGAVMRHLEAGLAIPDFPTTGGEIIPLFDARMIHNINVWRFEHNLNPVNMSQVIVHFLHRVWALVVVAGVIALNYTAARQSLSQASRNALWWLNALIVVQVALGILTVWLHKEVYITTLHVANGAGVLGCAFFFLLRTAPTRWSEFKQSF